jgi:Tfp pilus assembly protein FimT
MVELLFVVALMAVLSTMSVLQIGASRASIKGDGAMRLMISQMTTAREMAIGQRRFMRVVMTNPNTVQIIREEVPGPATTVISSIFLEGGPVYMLMPGLPDTPDGFGTASAIAFGNVVNIKFTPDGTLVNQNGVTINGTVFMGMSGAVRSARAVTVLGSTGRIRGYRYDGNSWKLV